MTVGFYSPLPPARSGVADYSAALARYLQAHCQVRFNADGDVNLYHIGNNLLHASIYRRALERPGVVVLHDAVLHHFMLGVLSRTAYIEEFIYNYGSWSRTQAEDLWCRRRQSAADPTYFRYPFLKRLAEASSCIIVHNPAAARMVREHHSSAMIVQIPHLLIPHTLPHLSHGERLRGRWGPGLVLGIFGHLRESKRLLPILHMLTRRHEWKLLVAGQIAARDLQRASEPYFAEPNIVRCAGFLNPREYWTAAQSVDACINLRYPAAGETSGVSIGMMGASVPVIMSDAEENSTYPAGTCLKVGVGLSEAAELEAVLEWADRRRALLRDIGAMGSVYVQNNHGGQKVAETVARVLAAG